MVRLELLLLGAAAASAHPGHGHSRLHNKNKRNIGDPVCATINGVYKCWTQESNYWDGTASTTTAKATTAAVAAVNVNVNAVVGSSAGTSTSSSSIAVSTGAASSSTSSSTDATGYTVSEYTDFDSVACKSSTKKRATLAQIAQVGNVGGDCYGRNMLVVSDEDVAEQYENFVKFYGATEDMTCAYWNKIGPDGGIDGWYKSSNPFTFTLPSGGNVWLVAQNGTQGGASCFPKSTGIEYDDNGAVGGTWVEFTFVDVTTGWSAYDASCIIAENGKLNINGVEVCLNSGDTCSAIGAGLSSITAAFNAALATADGIGGNFGTPIKIAANMGYS